MSGDFEDHCWQDIVSPPTCWKSIPLQAQDLRRPGSGAARHRPLRTRLSRAARSRRSKLAKTHPSSCGDYAHEAIEPTKRLFAAARAAGLPIFYSTGDTRGESRPDFVTATKRVKPSIDAADYAIRPEFKPQPGDVVITKQRASAFYGTPLDRASHATRHPDSDRVRRKHVGLRARQRGRRLFAWLPCRAGRGMLLRSQPAVAQGQSVRHASQICRRDARRRGHRASRQNPSREEGKLT